MSDLLNSGSIGGGSPVELSAETAVTTDPRDQPEVKPVTHDDIRAQLADVDKGAVADHAAQPGISGDAARLDHLEQVLGELHARLHPIEVALGLAAPLGDDVRALLPGTVPIVASVIDRVEQIGTVLRDTLRAMDDQFQGKLPNLPHPMRLTRI